MEHIKKHESVSIILLSIIIIISIILTVISATLYHQIKDLYTTTNELRKSVKTLYTVSEKSESETTVFLLKEYDGNIGIFDSAGVLIDVIDVQIKSLPEADRNMLRTGIYAFSQNELMSLIEDYTG